MIAGTNASFNALAAAPPASVAVPQGPVSPAMTSQPPVIVSAPVATQPSAAPALAPVMAPAPSANPTTGPASAAGGLQTQLDALLGPARLTLF